MRVLIDIDVPVVATDKVWMKYLLSHYSLADRRGLWTNPLPYNLTKLFIIPDKENDYHIGDGMEFWGNFQLYDNLIPREDSLQYIPLIAALGCEVIFCSRVIGNHGISKENFIKKWFPCNSGIVFTKEKYLIKGDVLIDDSVVNLNAMFKEDPSVFCIKFREDYLEEEEPLTKFQMGWGWQHTYDLIKEKMNG